QEGAGNDQGIQGAGRRRDHPRARDQHRHGYRDQRGQRIRRNPGREGRLMTKLAANLTMLFNEVPFMDRFEQAAKNGFKGVEFLFPYDFPAADVAAKLKENNLEMVLHNLPAGNWGGGERGIACHPDRVAEFKEGVDKALEYAKVLGTQRINCLAGIVPAGVSYEQAEATFVSNLKYAAEKLKAAGIPLLI